MKLKNLSVLMETAKACMDLIQLLFDAMRYGLSSEGKLNIGVCTTKHVSPDDIKRKMNRVVESCEELEIELRHIGHEESENDQ